MPEESHGPSTSYGQQGRRCEGSSEALQRELACSANFRHRKLHIHSSLFLQLNSDLPTGPLPVRYSRSLDHHDAELESLREDIVTFTQQLPRSDLHRDDGSQQPDQRCSLEIDSAWYCADSHESCHW